MEGRAPDQRHDGCRRSHAAALPRQARSGSGRRNRTLDPAQPTARRDLGDLLRRTSRPVDHGRGVCGIASGRGRPRRRAHAVRRWLGARARRHRRDAGLYPDLAGHARTVGLGILAGAPARDHGARPKAPPQHLRLRVLGPPDDRRTERRHGLPASACVALRTRRAPRAQPTGATTFSAHARWSLRRLGPPPAPLRALAGVVLAAPPRCGGWPSARPSAGSSSDRSQTACGEASSHRSSTPSSPSISLATRRTTRCCGPPSTDWRNSASTTTRVDGSRRASHPYGTPPSPSSRWPMPAWLPTTRPFARPATGSWKRRSGCAATGRCVAPTWHPAGGRSNSKTTTTPTSTTPPRWSWPSVARRCHPQPTLRCDRAVRWTLGLQCREGGWGAFDADNDSDLVAASAVLRLRGSHRPPFRRRHRPRHRDARRRATDTAALSRAVHWLWAQQEADGSWFGRWGVNYVYGTGAAVPALMAAGVSQDDQRIRRAVAWLEEHQNEDGGWGEDLRSYVDPEWAGSWRVDGVPDRLGPPGLAGGGSP